MSDPSPNSQNLTGKLLIASPGIDDPRFEGAVIFLCAHDQNGAMGVSIHQRIHDQSLKTILELMNIPSENKSLSDIAVHQGGPVETARGFILHTGKEGLSGATTIEGTSYHISGTQEALREMGQGRTPEECLFILGFAGWGPGQLEQEIKSHVWIHCEADRNLIFGIDPEQRWRAALKKIGIDPNFLSAKGGSA